MKTYLHTSAKKGGSPRRPLCLANERTSWVRGFNVFICSVVAYLFCAEELRADQSMSFVPGQSVTLSVQSEGTAPFTYEWRKDGVVLSGATGATLALTSCSASNAGSYSVVVSNSAGSTVSDTAYLMVEAVTAPMIVAQPLSVTAFAGSPVTLTAEVAGSGSLSLQWCKNGVALVDGGVVSGAKTAALTIANVSAADGAAYTLVVSNAGGSVTSQAAVLTVMDPYVPPMFTTQPVSESIVEGGSVTLVVAASGSPSPSFQWYKNGVAMADGSRVSGATTATLVLIEATSADMAVYTVVARNLAGDATSAGATLTVTPAIKSPEITTHPVSKSVTEGDSTILSAAATGNPAPAYRWRKNGVDLSDGGGISGAGTATLTLSAVSMADAGVYALVATNSAGEATSSGATLSVTARLTAPIVTTQPVSRSVKEGSAVSFTVVVEGNPVPTYRWFKDGVALADGGNVSGSTSIKLTLASAAKSDAGIYTLAATNSMGTVLSSGAALTVSSTTSQKGGGKGSVKPTATETTTTSTADGLDWFDDAVPVGFDVAGYFTRYPKYKQKYGSNHLAAWLYYRDYGVYAGEVYDEVFRPAEYLVLYPDVAALYGTDLRYALLHWLGVGMAESREGRLP